MQKSKLKISKKIVISVIAAILIIAVAVLCALYFSGVIRYAEPVQSESGKYLFVYFTGNEPEKESIHFAVSEDGYNFTPVNGNEAVIGQELGTGSVRDPYILQGVDGCYYIIGTDMKSDDGWKSNHALVTWKSEDLITWTDETIIDIRDFGGEFANTTRAWAPQAIWDEEKQMYMIYWANSTEENDNAVIYYSYTADFKTITEPTLLYERDGIQTIDADIIYNENNGKYYMYFKHDEDSSIAYVTADSLTGPYDSEPVVISQAPSGVEGSSIYNISGTDSWVIIMDEYGKERFVAEQTTNFENFTKIKNSDIDFDFSARHGSVIQISDEEYDTLLEAYN
ncbi:MAG: glycoside hydrolase family 43 protein [Clostridiales bacterium]|nr:glycoside hydrolase family 43 protein [Clostridiales bacterium]